MNNFSREVNQLAAEGKPFLFIVDFEIQKPLVYALGDLPTGISVKMSGMNDPDTYNSRSRKLEFKSSPVSFKEYSSAFDIVKENIGHGNSYLLNLTFPTNIETNVSLKEIYNMSKSKYKLLVDNEFVVFSPETFIQIEGDVIKTFPMKGTIDASVEDALNKILSDEKELSEHNTIVDLLRNDLSIVASEVKVNRYRYNDIINTGDGQLIQISSEICGRLEPGWESNLGDILLKLLPAGSVSGAPKKGNFKNYQGERGYTKGVLYRCIWCF